MQPQSYLPSSQSIEQAVSQGWSRQQVDFMVQALVEVRKAGPFQVVQIIYVNLLPLDSNSSRSGVVRCVGSQGLAAEGGSSWVSRNHHRFHTEGILACSHRDLIMQMLIFLCLALAGASWFEMEKL